MAEKSTFLNDLKEKDELRKEERKNRKIARDQGNIKRENEKLEQLKEKGWGYYFDKIKAAIASVIWFVPNVIAYAIHGRIITESVDTDIQKNQVDRDEKKNKENEKQESKKEEQEKENVNLKEKKIENSGLAIVDNELKVKGTDKSIDITVAMLKDNEAADKISVYGIAKDTENIYIKNDMFVNEKNEKLDMKTTLAELDQKVFFNKYNIGMLLGELREEQLNQKTDKDIELSSFKFNDVTYSIIRESKKGELMLSDEEGNKVNIADTSQEDVYKWVKTYNDRLINIEEAKELFDAPEFEDVRDAKEQDAEKETDTENKQEQQQENNDKQQEEESKEQQEEQEEQNNKEEHEEYDKESDIEEQEKEEGSNEHDEKSESDSSEEDIIKDMFNENPEPEMEDMEEEKENVSEEFNKEYINNELDDEIDEEQSIIKEGNNTFGTTEGEEFEEYDNDEVDIGDV